MFKFFKKVDFVMVAFFLFGIALMIGVFFAAVADVKNNKRLMDACMADGYKEWQCTAMLRRNDTTPVVVPVPVPTYR